MLTFRPRLRRFRRTTKLQVEIIEHGSPESEITVALRERVLRQSLGLEIYCFATFGGINLPGLDNAGQGPMYDMILRRQIGPKWAKIS